MVVLNTFICHLSADRASTMSSRFTFGICDIAVITAEISVFGMLSTIFLSSSFMSFSYFSMISSCFFVVSIIHHPHTPLKAYSRLSVVKYVYISSGVLPPHQETHDIGASRLSSLVSVVKSGLVGIAETLT